MLSAGMTYSPLLLVILLSHLILDLFSGDNRPEQRTGSVHGPANGVLDGADVIQLALQMRSCRRTGHGRQMADQAFAFLDADKAGSDDRMLYRRWIN